MIGGWKMKHAALFLAQGFEQIEALGTLDVLRRAGVPVVTVAVGTPDLYVTSTHKVTVKADCMIDDVKASDLMLAVFPGGMPGAANLAGNEAVLQIARDVYAAGGITAAICAAPMVLSAAGILDGHKYTCYPGCEARIGGDYTGSFVEIDGQIVTACGPGASLDFAFAILEKMDMADTAATIAKNMQLR